MILNCGSIGKREYGLPDIVAGDNEIKLIVGDTASVGSNNPDDEAGFVTSIDGDYAYYAFIVDTVGADYTVNWGDGTTDTFASGVKAEHTYTKGTGTWALTGDFTFFEVSITSVATITRFYVQHHSLRDIGQTNSYSYLKASFGTAGLTNCYGLFAEYTTPYISSYVLESCKFVPISLPNVTDLGHAFFYCSSLKEIDLSPFINVTNVSYTFHSCLSLNTTLDVSSLSNVVTAQAFLCNTRLIDVVGLENMTENTDAYSIFENASSIVHISMPNWSHVVYAYYLAHNCTSLESLDISGWTHRIVGETWSAHMIKGCPNLKLVDMRNGNWTAIQIDSIIADLPVNNGPDTYTIYVNNNPENGSITATQTGWLIDTTTVKV